MHRSDRLRKLFCSITCYLGTKTTSPLIIEDDVLMRGPLGLKTTLLDDIDDMPHFEPSSGFHSPMPNHYQSKYFTST